MKESRVPLRPKRSLRKQNLRGRQLLQGLCSFAAGFLMSPAKLMGSPIPLAACLISAFPPGFCSLSAGFGAVSGYLLFTDGIRSVELVVMSLLILASVLVFQGTALPEKYWFFPLMSAVLWLLLRGIGLHTAREIPQWLLQGAVCAPAAATFRRAMLRDRGAAILAVAGILCGLSSLELGIDPGLLLACAFCVALGSPKAAIAFGLALDLSHGAVPSASLALAIPSVILQKYDKKNLPIYGAGFMMMGALILLLFSPHPTADCFALAAGTALGLLLHRFPLLSAVKKEEFREDYNSVLRNAARVIRLLREQLPREADVPCESEAESVYDGAAECVCRCCERFHRCWVDRQEETCSALNSAARGIITAGTAAAEDFPRSFRENCCHLEGFVTAVNQELEGMLFRRQYRMRLRESSMVVAQELRCIEEFLLSAKHRNSVDRLGYDTYLPEVGVCSMSREGAMVNGDRSRRFYMGRHYYILLCDGMGSGEAASQMSGETISLLEELLKSGMCPENALKLLNGAELLRGEDRFTTVDLLSIDLETGQAELLKWGSAPSYYRSGEEVKKIGTASPPPGVGVGGEHIPERYLLSLSGGELLVLRSDGACGEEIEEALRSYTGRSSVALAAYLISGISGEDDMTALTVSLRLHFSS